MGLERPPGTQQPHGGSSRGSGPSELEGPEGCPADVLRVHCVLCWGLGMRLCEALAVGGLCLGWETADRHEHASTCTPSFPVEISRSGPIFQKGPASPRVTRQARHEAEAGILLGARPRLASGLEQRLGAAGGPRRA